MRVVIVGQYYWPDIFTINDIAEDLVKKGHTVKVLTGLPDYANNEIPEEFKHGKRRHEIRNGVEIFRVPIIPRYTGVLHRVINYISFYISSSSFARHHLKELDCDVVMAYQTAPVLMGNAAILLKKKLKKKLLFYCMDIWPDQMKVWHVGERNPLFKIMRRYCQYAYGSGDILAVSSRPFIEYMINVNKVDPKKIVYLPNHYDKIDDEKLEKTFKDKDGINLILAGNIGQQQNVECLLRAVKRVQTEKVYHIHIYGEGTSYQACRNLARKLGVLNHVTFYGRVPKAELYNIYPQMDAFILTLCSEKQIGYVANTVPSRLQGYMTGGKPIIASIDGGAREIINECQCGIAVPADDDQALADALVEFIENKDKYAESGKRARKYFDENFERSVVMNRIEGYLKDLAGVK